MTAPTSPQTVLDPDELADLAGLLAWGWPDDEVVSRMERIQDALGLSGLVCVWGYVDEDGFGGDSDIFLRRGEELLSLTVPVWDLLTAGAEGPASPEEIDALVEAVIRAHAASALVEPVPTRTTEGLHEWGDHLVEELPEDDEADEDDADTLLT